MSDCGRFGTEVGGGEVSWMLSSPRHLFETGECLIRVKREAKSLRKWLDHVVRQIDFAEIGIESNHKLSRPD